MEGRSSERVVLHSALVFLIHHNLLDAFRAHRRREIREGQNVELRLEMEVGGNSDEETSSESSETEDE